ncbi:MAG: hypothetical protein ACO1SV_10570 [Fimbriimonas sp.]
MDLRAARRWERARLAVIANLLFVMALQLPTPDRDPRSLTIFLSCLYLAIFLGLSLNAYSFVDAARRAQLDALMEKLGLRGCHVVCRYYDGELELGVDQGWLGRDGYVLRFEGAVSRFVLPRDAMVDEPKGWDVTVEVDDRPIRISIRGQKSRDRGDAEQLLQGWPASHEAGSVILPPSTPQARNRLWYIVRALEIPGPLMAIALPLAWMIKGFFVPQGMSLLRWALLIVPLAIYLLATPFLARRLRRRDEALLAALPASSVPAAPPLPEAPQNVSNAS